MGDWDWRLGGLGIRDQGSVDELDTSTRPEAQSLGGLMMLSYVRITARIIHRPWMSVKLTGREALSHHQTYSIFNLAELLHFDIEEELHLTRFSFRLAGMGSEMTTASGSCPMRVPLCA